MSTTPPTAPLYGLDGDLADRLAEHFPDPDLATRQVFALAEEKEAGS